MLVSQNGPAREKRRGTAARGTENRQVMFEVHEVGLDKIDTSIADNVEAQVQKIPGQISAETKAQEIGAATQGRPVMSNPKGVSRLLTRLTNVVGVCRRAMPKHVLVACQSLSGWRPGTHISVDLSQRWG